MKGRKIAAKGLLILVWAVLSVFGSISFAHAQAMPMWDVNGLAQQNMAFGQMMDQQLQQQLMQSYMASHPSLPQQYQEFVAMTGMAVPFDQFVMNHMATAGGRNPGPALANQMRNGEALRNAGRTAQQGADSYIQSMQRNSERTANAIEMG